MNLAARQKPDVRVHAPIGLGDSFHVSGPAKAWRIHDSLHPSFTGRDDIYSYAADFAVLSGF